MARERRKTRIGQVVSHKMDKTAIVEVRWNQRHPIYNKLVRRVTKFYVHDKENDAHVGDVVKIEETRRISNLKRWRVIEIVQRHEVAEVKPIELDQAVLAELEEPKAEPTVAVAAAAPESAETAVAPEAESKQ